MVAVIVVALWFVVVTPLGVAGLVMRRRSSLTEFEASIRGLDRTTVAAVATVGQVGPVRDATIGRRRPQRSSIRRSRRRRTLVGVGVGGVAATLAVAVVDPSRGTLAVHAATDQCFVAYCTAIVATAQSSPRTPARTTGPSRRARTLPALAVHEVQQLSA